MNRRSPCGPGRYGTDPLSVTTSLTACLLLVLSMFIPDPAGKILFLLAIPFLVISYFRIFSRNIAKRRRENECFCRLLAPLSCRIQLLKQRRREKNLYSFFRCPSCGTVLRVPKCKARLRITCKSCGHVFERKS